MVRVRYCPNRRLHGVSRSVFGSGSTYSRHSSVKYSKYSVPGSDEAGSNPLRICCGGCLSVKNLPRVLGGRFGNLKGVGASTKSWAGGGTHKRRPSNIAAVGATLVVARVLPIGALKRVHHIRRE